MVVFVFVLYLAAFARRYEEASESLMFVTLRVQPQLVVGLRIVQECELALVCALSFFVYFFTATRSFALRDRGL